MKKLTVLFAFLFLVALSVQAEEAKTETKESTSIEWKNQTNCPVMGGKIDSSSYTDIQGQRVYHCCPGCTKALKNDPDKYFKEAAANGILFENIQTTCPVSGKELEEKSVKVDFEGRRVYFCCENCIPTFEKDPQTYLKKLDEPASDKPEEKHNH